MSIYGWFFWTQKTEGFALNTIGLTSKKDIYVCIILFTGSLFFVLLIYKLFDKWNDWSSPIDTFTTSLFFVAMWLMARRKNRTLDYLDSRRHNLNSFIYL